MLRISLRRVQEMTLFLMLLSELLLQQMECRPPDATGVFEILPALHPWPAWPRSEGCSGRVFGGTVSPSDCRTGVDTLGCAMWEEVPCFFSIVDDGVVVDGVSVVDTREPELEVVVGNVFVLG